MHFFFEIPFFDTLANCQNNIFTPLHTICVLKTPKKHYKIGESKHKKTLGQIFSSTLDRFSAQETPNLGQVFSSIYIYKSWTDFQLYSTHIHTYIYICCRVNNLASISQYVFYCFLLFFLCFSKILFFLQGE